MGVCNFATLVQFVQDREEKVPPVKSFLKSEGGIMASKGERLEAFAWGRIYKKSLFEEVRFPVGRYYEDLFIIPTILFKANKTIEIDLPLYYYFQGNNGAITKSYSPQKDVDYLEAHQHNLDYFQNRSGKIYQLFFKRVISDATINLNYTKDIALKKECKEKIKKLLRENKKHIKLLDYEYANAICSVLSIRWLFKAMVKLKIIQYKE